jgi:hypothetical protein
MTNRFFSRVAMMTVAMMFASLHVQAETVAIAAAPAATPAPAIVPDRATEQAPVVSASESSFDSYRVMAVAAGVIGGAVIAGIVTNGLILPAYYWATGSAGVGGGMMASAGGASGGMMAGAGATAFQGVMQILGAVGGGFYANSWYSRQ